MTREIPASAALTMLEGRTGAPAERARRLLTAADGDDTWEWHDAHRALSAVAYVDGPVTPDTILAAVDAAQPADR